MIIDSHCHAWDTWPYHQPVPDRESRGKVEQLLYEMDCAGVDQAVIVCAQLEHNLTNNLYVAEQILKYPDRLHQLADLDSEWSETYHQPGAAERLRQVAAELPVCGFTHYLKREEDGSWLNSQEGQEMLDVAEDLRLLVSLSCYPHQQPEIRKAAARHSSVSFLCHHLGFPAFGKESGGVEFRIQENVSQILKSADVENIYLKVSGFAYAAGRNWDFPYADIQWILKSEYQAFGPHRLCWGSDYPVVRSFMTYPQSLEVLRSHCPFIPADEMQIILGGNLSKLLKRE